MNFYSYDPGTSLFLGVGVADQDPLDAENFLIPAHATTIEPPLTGAGKLAKFDAVASTWSLIDAEVQPDPVSQEPVVKTLAEIKADKVVELSLTCQAAIFTGFDSDALGVPHHYPAKITDQQNLTASVVASLIPGIALDWGTPFWCQDSQGQWAYTMHNATQIQKVGLDAKTAVLDALTKNARLAAQVAQAQSVEEVRVIVW